MMNCRVNALLSITYRRKTHALSGLMLSFILHVLVVTVIIVVSNSIVATNRPVVIDFSIEDVQWSRHRTQESRAEGKRTEIRDHEPQIKEQQPVVMSEGERIVSPIIPENHPVSDAETQAPVPASAEKNPSPENRDRGLIANNNTKTDAKVVSGGNAGGSAEEVKNRYLKNHFSYIRDRILKNLTYPKIAREMGWQGKVTISFVVCENGQAQDIIIKEGSGFGVLDKNAVETIKRASPFPSPPVKAELIMPVVYRIE